MPTRRRCGRSTAARSRRALEKPVLAKKFGEIVFPQTDRERKEKLRASIAATARRLSSMVAEDGSPVPKQLAIRVEETIGELLETIEN